MAPLMVVQALAESEFATLSDIKVRARGEGGRWGLFLSASPLPLFLQPYIVKHLQRENEQIAKVTTRLHDTGTCMT